MKFACTRARREYKDGIVISFFFNARGHDLGKSTEGMYRSLLLQLLHKLDNPRATLDDSDIELGHVNRPIKLDTENLFMFLTKAIELVDRRSLFFFIDALDECDDRQVRAMLEDFSNLAQHAMEINARVHICFSSRHYPHIHIQHGRQLNLDNQIGHGHDIEKFIQSKLEMDSDDFALEIKTQILEKAAGVFMWVVLVVDILNQEFGDGRQFAVQKRLKKIPTEVSELFMDMIQRDKKNMADFLLSIRWILFSRRPLTVEELYFAVNLYLVWIKSRPRGHGIPDT
jgi:hypothetical protein